MADRNGELDPTEAWPPVGTNSYDATAGAFASLGSDTAVACDKVGECGTWDEPDSGVWHFPHEPGCTETVCSCDRRVCGQHCDADCPWPD